MKLAAVCRHAATSGAGDQVRNREDAKTDCFRDGASHADGPEGRWKLAGATPPDSSAAARCAPAGARETPDTIPAPFQGAGQRWSDSGGIAALNPRLISTSPAELMRLGVCVPRFAAPPALGGTRSGFRQKAAIFPPRASDEIGGVLPTRRYARREAQPHQSRPPSRLSPFRSFGGWGTSSPDFAWRTLDMYTYGPAEQV